ncbi:MAG: DNA-binding NarL/FixJ family response regulator [Polaribacter sp.]|jgi:DNA-binding NarL/FixJ family response regulator
MIEIGIIDDDAFMRSELVKILKESSRFHLVLFSESAEKFLKYCSNYPEIKLILIDIGLPGISGIEAIPKLMNKLPNVEIVILTTLKDNDTIFKAFRAGANGYILKDVGLDKIEKSLENIGKGIPAVSPAILRRLVDFFKIKRIDVSDVQLTERESAVLKFLVDGLSYKLIVDKMDFSINGVRYYVKNIYKKLHINSRSELMKLVQDGEITFNDYR